MSEAERLAKALEAGERSGMWYPSMDAAAELRRLSAELAALKAAIEAQGVPDGWQPIETAPESMDECVVVGWLDDEGLPRTEFDYKEDGCWIKWHEHAEHTEVIGGHGVSYTPPYTHWLKLPPLASAPPAPQAKPIGWLYDWTHSSALGKPDEHFTSFTTDEEHARKNRNARPVFDAAQQAKPQPLSDDRDARIAELEQRNRDLYEDVQRFKEHALNEKAARLELERQLEEARKDAERYRWLRRTRFIWSDFSYISGVYPTVVGLEFGWFPSKNNRPSREDLDAAIDAAMKGQQ